MPPEKKTTPPALVPQEDESVILDRIKCGQLLTWIYGTAKQQSDSADFMKSVCYQLDDMQKRGLIKGFRTALTGSQPLPIVSRVEVVASASLM